MTTFAKKISGTTRIERIVLLSRVTKSHRKLHLLTLSDRILYLAAQLKRKASIHNSGVYSGSIISIINSESNVYIMFFFISFVIISLELIIF